MTHPLSRRARDLRHGVLTLGSKTPNTPGRIVRQVVAGGLAGAVRGKVVLVTGASSGIGEATAIRLGAAGATVVLVARSEDALQQVAARIAEAGGTADVRPCDLTDLDAVGVLAEVVLAEHGAVDVLVNNAGRSIRRSIADSYDRMHDFERTMQINYYGPVKLTLGLLPAMRAQGRGQIVNVLSEGLLLQTPKFAAYLASKSALDSFSRCVANEVRGDGVRVTGVHMPLVRTPMIAPTAAYERVPALRPEEAADLICEGIVTRAFAVTAREGLALQLARSIAPGTLEAGISLVTRRLGATGRPAPAGTDVSGERRIPAAR
ncbi:SDR family NAD(P)-dependent oxidoreductase [Patulibacter sp.]|uniref:SDR family NAD(P)-dependent oxidoreductase n=1 Tax=Patulibacter sp. TaxID=1912859 RepID=UPI0027172B64|nr:SDR family NAD(P)-dependent oxidoreductase [Patulibacter sp.]MDO9407085.1 SDR family NAD(P)-dependent oxidoreductase [Patulibacter sp.]